MSSTAKKLYITGAGLHVYRWVLEIDRERLSFLTTRDSSRGCCGRVAAGFSKPQELTLKYQSLQRLHRIIAAVPADLEM
jgi:hypothetical protein